MYGITKTTTEKLSLCAAVGLSLIAMTPMEANSYSGCEAKPGSAVFDHAGRVKGRVSGPLDIQTEGGECGAPKKYRINLGNRSYYTVFRLLSGTAGMPTDNYIDISLCRGITSVC